MWNKRPSEWLEGPAPPQQAQIQEEERGDGGERHKFFQQPSL